MLIKMPGAVYSGAQYGFDGLGNSNKIGGTALALIRQNRENLSKEAEAAKVRQETAPVPVQLATSTPIVRRRGKKVETSPKLDTTVVHVLAEKFPAPYEHNTDARTFSLPNMTVAKAFMKDAFSNGEFDKVTFTFFMKEQCVDEQGNDLPGQTYTSKKVKEYARNVASEPKQSFKDEDGILASHGICVREDGYVADPESLDKVLLPLSTRNRYTRLITIGKHGEFKTKAVCEKKDYNRNPRWQKNTCTTKVTFSRGLVTAP